MQTREEQIEERKVRRESAGRYAGGILLHREVLGWLNTHFPDNVRAGRLNGELLVTIDAFDNVPGDNVQRMTNKAGETVYRKKLTVPGAPTIDIVLTTIVDEGSLSES